MLNCKIRTFNRENLLDSLSFVNTAGDKLFPANQIAESHHFEYLLSYLSTDNGDNLNCKTILVEDQYFSESYFHDYINYYVSCYAPILKTCQRVHFFSTPFGDTEFEVAINKHDDSIWEAYLGYVVIKPIPKGTIGATVLKHYDNHKLPGDGKERDFFAVKDYYINLFGKNLRIDTMIYQEQDSIIGACATAALWFALHQLNRVFNIPVLSPAQITMAAGYRTDSMEPMIPSKGLTMAQVLKAIYSVNLTADVYTFTEYDYTYNDKGDINNLEDIEAEYALEVQFIKLHTNAYSHLRVPLLLGIALDLPDEEESNHLVTIAGQRFDEAKTNAAITFVSDKIDRLFVHDDQVGPFSKLKFLPFDIGEPNLNITTSWKRDRMATEDDSNKIKGKANVLIIPLSSDIKVHFKNIYEEFLVVAALMDEWAGKKKEATEHLVFYDIYICESNKYKQQVVEMGAGTSERGLQLLLTSFPKYIWVIQAFSKPSGNLVFDILHDPYDANFKFAPIMANIYSQQFTDALEGGNLNTPYLLKLKAIFNNDSELRSIAKNMVRIATGEYRNVR
jgi:hypothetical protein